METTKKAWINGLKWNGFGLADDVWAIVILIGAILLAVGVLSKIRNAVSLLPIAWAYFGIYQLIPKPQNHPFRK
ncbi:MAG: hypothetical protein PHV71_08200 [Eubacteriales bacterium]|nr:hypothetical protein [Eubacteriales bacterium]MDD3200357.1 hypothetical protein [Eubacteriales bacterium]MDD4121870.1 hypothetical protein [Eubacteriales bacterium]MDD4630549.1 hypothetical protein [Eubacteriales bacterium]